MKFTMKRLMALLLACAISLPGTVFSAFSAEPDGSGDEAMILFDAPARSAADAVRTNVALGKTVTASESEPNTSFTPDKAVDGMVNRTVADKRQQSRWGTNQNPVNPWIQIDLGDTYEVQSLKIEWERSNVTSYNLQMGTDADALTTVETFTSAPETLTQEITLSEPVSARYIQLNFTDFNGGTENWRSVSLYELEVYADVDLNAPIVAKSGTNLARGKTATASSQEAESVRPTLAVDGNTGARGSRWGSNVGDKPAWLQIDLGAVYQVQRFRIFWERLTAKHHKIELSANGSDWKTVYEEASLITSVKESVVLDQPDTARYVRLSIPDYLAQDEAGATALWDTISLYEFEIYPDNAQLLDDGLLVETSDDTFAPAVPGYSFSDYIGTDYEQVIGADRRVYHPIVDTWVRASMTVTPEGGAASVRDIPVLVKGTMAQTNTGNPVPSVSPELREWVGGSGNFTVGENARILVNPAHKDALQKTAEAFAADYLDMTGRTLSIAEGTEPGNGDFYFTLGSADAGLGKEGYRMTAAEHVRVEAAAATGAYWATRTILQILKQNGTTIPQGTARDYPKFAVRTLSMDVGRKPFDEAFLEDLVKNMSWYKMNDLNVHLSDNYIWLKNYSEETTLSDAYSGFRLESRVGTTADTDTRNQAPLTSADEFYTKDWFRQFIQDSRDRGIDIVPEFDTPAHALSFTKVRPDLRTANMGGGRNGNDHLDLNTQLGESLAFTQSVWDEYMEGDHPVFDENTIINVGTDEYDGGGSKFLQYMKAMFEYVHGKNRTVRAWGSITSALNGGGTQAEAAAVPVENVQLYMWYPGYADPKNMYDRGYKMISLRDGPMYIVPGASYYQNYLDARGRYGSWTPYDTGTSFTAPAGSPQVLGGGFACWNDLIDKSKNGLSMVDVYDRIAAALPAVAEKTWGEAQQKTFDQLTALASALGDAPNSNPRMKLKGTGAAIAAYALENTGDASGNGYVLGGLQNAELTDGGQVGKALRLAGGASYAALPIGTGGPDSIEFWVKMDADVPAGEQILFESDKGAIKASQKDTGKVGFSREEYDYSFNYTLPKGQWVKLRISSDLGTAKLYVNNTLTDTISGRLLGGQGTVTTQADWYGTMYLPLDRIGSTTKALKGMVDQVIVYRGTGTAPENVFAPSDSVTVTFRAGGGTDVARATVPGNSTVARPADPTRAAYVFDGWYKDASLADVWNFETDRATADTTLYAKWRAAIEGQPAQFGPAPSAGQLQYHKEELSAFVHFGVNTFTGKEWGTGQENPQVFNPTANPIDTEQWVKTLRDAGFERLIFTVKHHDGFVLYDSSLTEHDVMASPYGRDLLAEVSAACTKYNMDMGVYLSPWDAHDPSYGSSDGDADNYNDYYMGQLQEILGNPKYGNNGKFAEVWMDGAKGAGAAAQQYRFQDWFDLIKREEGENCVIFSPYGTEVRWIGNENGYGGEPLWQKVNKKRLTDRYDQGQGDENAYLNTGDENGDIWSIAEADVSISNGWFWHANRQVKSLDKLVDIYFNSVGRGTPLLLNVPPDKAGNFDQTDVERLQALKSAVDGTFGSNLIPASATAAADAVRAGSGFEAANVLDGNYDSYWTTPDGTSTATLTVDFGESKRFDIVALQEYIPLGQRIKRFTVAYRKPDGTWADFAGGQTIGYKRLLRSVPVTGDALRISIIGSNGVPLLNNVAVYKAVKAVELHSEIPEALSYTPAASSTGWTAEDYGNGRTNYWTNGDSPMTIPFTGTKFYLSSTRDPGHGTMNVSIDGGTPTEVNLQASPRTRSVLVYASPDLADGPHTVTLTKKSGGAIACDGLYVLNNGGRGMFELAQTAYTVDEGENVTLTIHRIGGTAGAAAVRFSTAPGSAVHGRHYQDKTELLSFAAGETSKTVTVATVDNQESAGNVSFYGELTDAENAALGFAVSAEITITDNDVLDPNAPITQAHPLSLSADTAVNVEAERAEKVGDAVEETQGQASVVGWMGTNGAKVGALKLWLDVPAPGAYDLLIRHFNGRANVLKWRNETTSGGGSVSLTFSGSNSDGAFFETTMPITFSQSGKQCLTFYNDEDGTASLDWFRFTPVPTPVTGVTLDQSTLLLSAGAVAQLTAAVQPAIASNQHISWFSSDTNVVAVDAAGRVTAVAAGTATITVTTADGNKTASCVVTVKKKSSGGTSGSNKPVTPPASDPKVYMLPDGTKLEITAVANGESTVKITLPSGKTEATVTIPLANPKPGHVAALVNADGTETVIPKSIVTDKGIVLHVSASVTVKIIQNSKQFQDMNQAVWAKDAVDFVTARELFGGTSDKTFGPNEQMNRAMLVTVLHRLEGKPVATGENKFADVQDGQYYTEAIQWASENSIVTGTDKGFEPEGAITREQLAAILYRYMGSPKTEAGELNFTDASNVSDWAADAMLWATQQGIITGKGVNNLDPQGNATRAEVATMLMRLMQK